jgi:hypothetical protein
MLYAVCLAHGGEDGDISNAPASRLTEVLVGLQPIPTAAVCIALLRREVKMETSVTDYFHSDGYLAEVRCCLCHVSCSCPAFIVPTISGGTVIVAWQYTCIAWYECAAGRATCVSSAVVNSQKCAQPAACASRVASQLCCVNMSGSQHSTLHSLC